MYRMCQEEWISERQHCHCLYISLRAEQAHFKSIHWLLRQIDFGIKLTQRQNGSNLIFVYPVLIKFASLHANALAHFACLLTCEGLLTTA